MIEIAAVQISAAQKYFIFTSLLLIIKGLVQRHFKEIGIKTFFQPVAPVQNFSSLGVQQIHHTTRCVIIPREVNRNQKKPFVIFAKKRQGHILKSSCLLYTSDAADDLLCVDL